jgi:hypothetical protein
MLLPCLSSEVAKNSLADALAIFPGYLGLRSRWKESEVDVQQNLVISWHWFRELLSCEGFMVRLLEVHIMATTASEALRRPRGAKRVSKYFHPVKTESHVQRIAIDSFSLPCQHQLPYGPLQGGC